jgi:hypothetical protein
MQDTLLKRCMCKSWRTWRTPLPAGRKRAHQTLWIPCNISPHLGGVYHSIEHYEDRAQ